MIAKKHAFLAVLVLAMAGCAEAPFQGCPASKPPLVAMPAPAPAAAPPPGAGAHRAGTADGVAEQTRYHHRDQFPARLVETDGSRHPRVG